MITAFDHRIANQVTRQIGQGCLHLLASAVGYYTALVGTMPQGHHLRAVLVGLSTLVLIIGLWHLRHGLARFHGLAVERRSTAHAAWVLEKWGFRVERNMLMRAGGDIDMVVSLDGLRLPVEIKSFRYWKQREARCQHALRQTLHEATYLRAPFGILWLPDADLGRRGNRRGLIVGDVLVVAGPSSRLAHLAFEYATRFSSSLA